MFIIRNYTQRLPVADLRTLKEQLVSEFEGKNISIEKSGKSGCKKITYVKIKNGIILDAYKNQPIIFESL